MATRIQIAKGDVFNFFDSSQTKIFKLADIASILSNQRKFWRLPQRMTTQAFISYLLDHGKLKRFDFPFPYRKEHRYAWGNVPFLEILLNVKKDSYFTHYTAMRMHGLTDQVPKTIYVNHEQRLRSQGADIAQSNLDIAFKRKPRTSQNIIEYEDKRICLVNGMNTDQLGVVEENVTYDDPRPARVRLTNLERTLIDITVRPVYSGGVSEVIKAFEHAKDKASVNRISAMLKKLAYAYPYHQAIGFYLERAGYKSTAIELIRQIPMELDFYLAHGMGKTEYVKPWRLHIPEGF